MLKCPYCNKVFTTVSLSVTCRNCYGEPRFYLWWDDDPSIIKTLSQVTFTINNCIINFSPYSYQLNYLIKKYYKWKNSEDYVATYSELISPIVVNELITSYNVKQYFNRFSNLKYLL